MTFPAMTRETEAVQRFECFGGHCTVLVQGSGPAGTAAQAAARGRRRLECWHDQFSRFDPDSELSELNRDSRETVPVTPMMSRFVEAALRAAQATGGLVDPTLVGELEAAGYAKGGLKAASGALADALRAAPVRRPAVPRQDGRWRQIKVDRAAGTVTRPAGLRLDSGGIAKGLFGDVLALVLDGHGAFAVDAAGDVRFGGTAELLRPVRVASPFDDTVLHTFELVRGAAATSGIGNRRWFGRDGVPAHHLLDPATGCPAFTGVVQVTALAPTAAAAEALSKAALLSGPERAVNWLCHGGVVAYDDGHWDIVDPAAEEPKT